MRDDLPKESFNIECGIVNLDNSSGPGTHWVAYYKNKLNSQYFDSFGNLKPPVELQRYLANNIIYNYNVCQKYDTFVCGHLCLIFLYNHMLHYNHLNL